MAAIVLTARFAGVLIRRLGQPQVMGEMLAGILLGPSFLGWAAPSVSRVLFPAASLAYLNALSQVGLVLFMFLVGLEFNTGAIRRLGRVAAVTSIVSIVLPFVLGSALAIAVYPTLADRTVTVPAFALFLGAAMSITAFPVLARILAERRLTQTSLGVLAIACASVGDVAAWCILAYVVAFDRAGNNVSSLWLMFAGVTLFALVMIFGVRRLLHRFDTMFQRHGRVTDDMMSVLLLLLLLSAAITEWLGIHLLFGAFLFGAILPRDAGFVRGVMEKLESVTVVLLLPIFFAFTGLRMSLGAIRGREMWFYCALITLTAIAGKLGGATIASRAAGVPWRTALALGVLMNTRGLMEMVILSVGLELGVINQAVFSMMILMAVVTTFLTTPLLAVIRPAITPEYSSLPSQRPYSETAPGLPRAATRETRPYGQDRGETK